AQFALEVVEQRLPQGAGRGLALGGQNGEDDLPRPFGLGGGAGGEQAGEHDGEREAGGEEDADGVHGLAIRAACGAPEKGWMHGAKAHGWTSRLARRRWRSRRASAAAAGSPSARAAIRAWSAISSRTGSR